MAGPFLAGHYAEACNKLFVGSGLLQEGACCQQRVLSLFLSCWQPDSLSGRKGKQGGAFA